MAPFYIAGRNSRFYRFFDIGFAGYRLMGGMGITVAMSKRDGAVLGGGRRLGLWLTEGGVVV